MAFEFRAINQLQSVSRTSTDAFDATDTDDATNASAAATVKLKPVMLTQRFLAGLKASAAYTLSKVDAVESYMCMWW